jgi:hypothetical protein
MRVGHGGRGLQGAAPRQQRAEARRAQADRAPPPRSAAPIKEQVIHFINKKMPGGLPKKTARALLDIEETRTTCRSSATRRAPPARPRRCSTSRAAARSGCSARSAWPRRPCSGTPACRPCCRRATCAAATRSAARPVRQGREDHHRQPGAVPPRGQHAELPGHQDRGGELRHLLRPAAGLRVRQDLPRLPHHRHPRIPAGKGHHAAGWAGWLPVPRPLPHAR